MGSEEGRSGHFSGRRRDVDRPRELPRGDAHPGGLTAPLGAAPRDAKPVVRQQRYSSSEQLLLDEVCGPAGTACGPKAGGDAAHV
jgi:hypothetical protein